MKLSRVEIHNYRPFRDISLNLFPYTVIIGENNVGKSNVLRALEMFFRPSQTLVRRALMRSRSGTGLYYRVLLQKVRTAQSHEHEYEYERDFPVVSQSGGGKRQTRIRVTFSPEANDFIKLKLDRKFEKRKRFSITQQIKIQRDRLTDLAYVSSTLSTGELEEFLMWLFQTVDYVRIPSTRGSAASQRLLRAFLVRIHAKLRASYRVKKFLGNVVERARREVDKAEREIQRGLKEFLQGLQSVELELGDVPDLSELLTVETVKLNDGTATHLESKGDGVQSLFFMGLAQYLAALKVNRSLIFGIEEPELHLHPNAQEIINRTLRSLVGENQVIITTHSPVMVGRGSQASNIVLTKDETGRAIHALPNPTMRKIREVLGVKPGHNLINALIVVLVEGRTDERLFEDALRKVNPQIGTRIDSADVRIVQGRGANGVRALVKFFDAHLQPFLAIFDADDEGNRAQQECVNEDHIDMQHLFVLPSKEEFRETEIEDHFDPSYTCRALTNVRGITITVEDFEKYRQTTGDRGKKPGKWGDATKVVLKQLGGIGTDPIQLEGALDRVKEAWVNLVTEECSSESYPLFIRTVANKLLGALNSMDLQARESGGVPNSIA